MIITDEDSNENAKERIGEPLLVKWPFYNTGQCENTFSSAFALLQSNNPLLIQNLGKFKGWRGGGKSLSWEAAAPCPTADYCS